jgi:hypothetical protein
MTMAVAQVSCPSCSAVLKSSQPLEIGTKVKCRKCGTKFLVSEPALTAASVRPGARANDCPPVDEGFDFSQLTQGLKDTPPLPPVAAALSAGEEELQFTKPGVASPALEAKVCGPNRLALVLVIAGSILFVGLGIALAVICFTADPPNGAENGQSEQKQAAENPEIPPGHNSENKKPPEVPPVSEKKQETAKPKDPELSKPIKPPQVEKKPESENRPPQVEKKPESEKPVETEKKPENEKPQDVAKKPAAEPDKGPLRGSKKLGPHLVTAGKPKPLSNQVKKALKWLASKQLKDGGWSPGGGLFAGFGGVGFGGVGVGGGGFGGVGGGALGKGAVGGGALGKGAAGGGALGAFGNGGGGIGGVGMPRGGKVKETSNVPDTCIAALALLRSGSSPQTGEYSKHILKAANYVCARVEKGDRTSLYLTKPARAVNPRFGLAMQPQTLVQTKIGTHADTFLATLFLSEVKDRMPTNQADARVRAALNKLITKMEKNQGRNGSWTTQGMGWAPVLGQALAAKGLNRARQAGAKVSYAVLEKATKFAEQNVDTQAGRISVGGMAAGVALYTASGTVATLQDWVNTYKVLEKNVRKLAQSSTKERERQLALKRLTSFVESKKTNQAAAKIVISNISNSKFVTGYGTIGGKGFGNAGGEEFLSYMNISEALGATGGPEWETWNKLMVENLNQIQNGDGTWSGHHCITGQTFCTSAALLTLMADRSPVPLVMKQKK